MFTLRTTVALAGMGFILACGNAELTVTPGAQNLSAGASAVSFTASGGDGTYQWALLPGTGVGVLSSNEGESVTFTPAASVPGETTGVLTVTSGRETTAIALTVSPRAINGRVVSLFGVPAVGVLVALAGPQGTFVTTGSDAEGNFSFASAPETYDLVVVDPISDTYSVHRGLTRLDPVVVAFGNPPTAPTYSASISGAVSGGAFGPSQPADHQTLMTFGSPNLLLTALPETVTSSTGSYSGLTAAWSSPASVSGTVHALQVARNLDGLPTGYPGYARLENVGLSNGSPAPGRDLTLAPVSTVPFSASVTLPVGATVGTATVYLQPQAYALLRLLDTSATSLVELPLPTVPLATATLVLFIYGTYGDTTYVRSGLPLDTSGLAVTPAQAPPLLSPASGATGVSPSTVFSWEAVPSSTYVVQFTPGASGPTVVLVTSEASTTLPQLSGLGVTLPPGAGYSWSLLTVHQLPSVDAFATGGYVPFIFNGVMNHTASEVSFTQSSASFTTAP